MAEMNSPIGSGEMAMVHVPPNGKFFSAMKYTHFMQHLI